MEILKNMKIRIKSPEHSKQVQECLFKLGFGWGSYLTKIPEFTDSPFLYANTSDNTVTWSDTYDYWLNHPNKEVTLEDLQAMSAEPEVIETNTFDTIDIPKSSVDNTINTYMSQIQKRLADVNMTIVIYADQINIANTDNEDETVVHSWDEVLEAIKVKRAYLNLFKGMNYAFRDKLKQGFHGFVVYWFLVFIACLTTELLTDESVTPFAKVIITLGSVWVFIGSYNFKGE